MLVYLTRFLNLSFLFISGVFLAFLLLSSSQAASKFELSASHTNATVKPSNVGVVGLRYLHKAGSYSMVQEVYPNTPASKAGIQYGDQILEIDGISVRPYDANGVFALMAGKPGDTVRLKILRCHVSCKEMQVDLKRMDMNYLASDQVFRIYKYGL